MIESLNKNKIKQKKINRTLGLNKSNKFRSNMNNSNNLRLSNTIKAQILKKSYHLKLIFPLQNQNKLTIFHIRWTSY